MPIHDLVCRRCGDFRPNVSVPLVPLPEPVKVHGFVTHTRVDFPWCCGSPMTYLPSRTTGFSSYDVRGFDVQVDDAQGGHVEHVGSLSDLRRIERESFVRHANGEGRPMVWRDYSQDRSNADVHTIAKDPAVVFTEAMRARLKERERTTGQPLVEATEYGPGVSDHNTSALTTLGDV